MKLIYEQVREFLQRGTPVALATIVEARGSTPREVGAKMIIESGGQIRGTVGGGCGENQVFQDALRVLKENRPRFSRVDLTGEINEHTETNCGGVMDVFIDSLRAESGAADQSTGATDILNAVLTVYEQRRLAVLITVLRVEGRADVQAGSKLVIDEEGNQLASQMDEEMATRLARAGLAVLENGKSKRASLQPEENDSKLDLFFEVLAPPAEIVIVGAGHIAQPLSKIAKLMDFEVTIIDDRANFANRVRFPEADRILVGAIDEAVETLPIGVATHLVLVTRGHQMDQAALVKVIASRAAYIGMIGSKRRVGAVFDYLRRQGIAEELMARVYAPIGIDLGAETPDEIAVSIMAEIIKLRRRGRAASLSDSRRYS